VVLGFVAYYRVSTDQQGRSGLGLEAQREAVTRHVAGVGGHLVAEFQEVESGKRADRPQLALALGACRARRAALIIAKLDRLARDTRFLLSVVRGAEDGVVFCDLPQLPPGPAGAFILTMFAAVAELEAGLISQRTKAAMAAAKARGVRMGNPKLPPGTFGAMRGARTERTRLATEHSASVMPYIIAARGAGANSLREIAAALTARGVQPPSGGRCWHASQVRRVVAEPAPPPCRQAIPGRGAAARAAG
jgi:DNA invertase Pin-like site-specific DNA recombinase